MKTGLLERILVRRYGPSVPCIRDGMPAKCWRIFQPYDESVLYSGMKWRGILGARFSSLREIYGDAFGGILIKNCLKAAVLLPREFFAVWNIDELRSRPAVLRALARDPGIDFFMDADNVYFYGVKAGKLFVFDAETDELDSLGPIEQALETIMDEFEAAREENWSLG
jgi:hypothetical protein